MDLVPCIKILRLNRGIFTTANGHRVNFYTIVGKANTIPQAADILAKDYSDAEEDEFVFLETVQPRHLS